MKIKLCDFRKAGFCRKGAELLCKSYGLDYETLRTEGLDETVVIATGHDYAPRVIEVARQREQQ